MGTRSLVVAGAVGLVFVAASMPASADTVGTTAATVTVAGGVLSITVSSSAGNLGTLSAGPGGSISGSLGQVQVSDQRGAVAGSTWVASVISSPFTAPLAIPIPASSVSYWAGAISQTGIATYTANNPANLSTTVAAVTATGISGDNVATWNPTITVVLPPGTMAGTYSASITHSVA